MSAARGGGAGGRLALWTALFLAAAAVRAVDARRPADGRVRESWRECDYAAVARNFVREGMDILSPRIDWRGDGPGFAEMEFPAVPWAMAALDKAFGYSEERGRWLMVAASLLALAAFAALARSLLPPLGALAASSVFAFSPLAVRVSNSLQPESLMLLLIVAAVYAFLRWLERGTWAWYALALAATAAAILVKLPAAHIGILFLALLLERKGPAALRSLRVWLFGLGALLPGVLWYLHAHRFWLVYGNSLGVSNESHWFGLDLLAHPAALAKLLGNLARIELGLVWTPVGALAAIFALAAVRRSRATREARGAQAQEGRATHEAPGARNAGGTSSRELWGAQAQEGRATREARGAQAQEGRATHEAPGARNAGGTSSRELWGAQAQEGRATHEAPGARNAGGTSSRELWGAQAQEGRAVRVGAFWLAAVAIYYAAAIRTTGDTWAAYYHVATAPAAALLIGAGLSALAARREEDRGAPRRSRIAVAAAGFVAILAFEGLMIVRDFHPARFSGLYACARAFKPLVPEGSLILCSGGASRDETGLPVAYNASYMFFWLDRKGFSIPADGYSLDAVEGFVRRGARYFVLEKEGAGPPPPDFLAGLKARATLLAECPEAYLFRF